MDVLCCAHEKDKRKDIYMEIWPELSGLTYDFDQPQQPINLLLSAFESHLCPQFATAGIYSLSRGFPSPARFPFLTLPLCLPFYFDI